MFRCQIHNEELVETVRGEYICPLCIMLEIKRLLGEAEEHITRAGEIFEGMEIEVDNTIEFSNENDD